MLEGLPAGRKQILGKEIRSANAIFDLFYSDLWGAFAVVGKVRNCYSDKPY